MSTAECRRREMGETAFERFLSESLVLLIALSRRQTDYIHVHLQLPDLPQLLTSPIVASTRTSGYWSIPSPLSFENIGFSRNAAPPTPSPSTSSQTIPTPPIAAGTIKYLICADCDQGPLGWHDTEGRDLGLEVEVENEGKGGELRKGREFLLSVERVRYAL